MAEIPLLTESVRKELEGHPDGISVKDLAAEMGESESSVRSALNYNLAQRRVTRRTGTPDGPTKPPYLYTLCEDPEEQETPPMPQITDVLPGPDGPVLDEGEGGVPAGGGDGTVPEDGQEAPDRGSFPSEAGPDQGPGGQDYRTRQAPSVVVPPAARGFQNRVIRDELQGAAAEVNRRTGHVTGGTFRVMRVEPIPAGFPVIELGVIGKSFELNMVGGLEDYVRDNFGGGNFLICPCDGMGNIYKDQRPIPLEIGGVPRPVTEEGRIWAEQYNRRLAKMREEGAPKDSKGRNEPSMWEIMEMQERKSREASQATAAMMTQVFQAARPQGPDPAGLESLKAQHASEIQVIRSDAERRVQDATRAFERQVEGLNTQITGLRADLEKAHEKADAALEKAEQRAAQELRNRVEDLERQREREIQALKEKHQAELTSAKEKFQAELSGLKESYAKDLERMKETGELKAAMAKLENKPQDFSATIQKHMAPDMAKVLLAKIRKEAGLGEEEEVPETLMDAIKGAIAEAGPDLLRRGADIVGNYVGQRAQNAPAAPPPPPTRPGLPQRPPAVRAPRPQAPRPPVANQVPANSLLRERGGNPGAPPPAPPIELTEEQQADLVAQGIPPVDGLDMGGVVEPEVIPPGEPLPQGMDDATVLEGVPPEGAVDPVQQAANLRLRTFFEVWFTEMRIDSEAAATWTTPVPGTDFDLETLYFKLPGKVRKAFEAVDPVRSWDGILTALGLTVDGDELLMAMQEHVDRVPEARKWIQDFLETGPWIEEEEEPQE